MRLGVFSHAANAYAPARFKEEAEKLGLDVELINYFDLDFKISPQRIEIFKKGEPIKDFDLTIFRSAGGLFYYVPQRDFLISWFSQKGAFVLNKETYEKWPRLDKLTQHFRLQKAGLPVIETALFGDKERLKKGITPPMIVKSFFGSQGKKVFKVEAKEEVEKILVDYLPGNLLVQPFLKTGEDIRVIVLGGQAVGAMKRIAQKGEFLTNYSVGGAVENFPLTKETKQLAEAASKAFVLDYVGVDLMPDVKGNWYLLEVNRAAQFEGFEKSTGINLAQKVIKWMLAKKK